jgi:hypothetical protein
MDPIAEKIKRAEQQSTSKKTISVGELAVLFFFPSPILCLNWTLTRIEARYALPFNTSRYLRSGEWTRRRTALGDCASAAEPHLKGWLPSPTFTLPFDLNMMSIIVAPGINYLDD